jgi:hypothetical protein
VVLPVRAVRGPRRDPCAAHRAVGPGTPALGRRPDHVGEQTGRGQRRVGPGAGAAPWFVFLLRQEEHGPSRSGRDEAGRAPRDRVEVAGRARVVHAVVEAGQQPHGSSTQGVLLPPSEM